MAIPTTLDLAEAAALWDVHGIVLLPGLLDADNLAAATAELPTLYPTADEFHDDIDPIRNARFRDDQFSGIDEFPWGGIELNLLAVHPKIVALA